MKLMLHCVQRNGLSPVKDMDMSSSDIVLVTTEAAILHDALLELAEVLSVCTLSWHQMC